MLWYGLNKFPVEDIVLKLFCISAAGTSLLPPARTRPRLRLSLHPHRLLPHQASLPRLQNQTSPTTQLPPLLRLPRPTLLHPPPLHPSDNPLLSSSADLLTFSLGAGLLVCDVWVAGMAGGFLDRVWRAGYEWSVAYFEGVDEGRGLDGDEADEGDCFA